MGTSRRLRLLAGISFLLAPGLPAAAPAHASPAMTNAGAMLSADDPSRPGNAANTLLPAPGVDNASPNVPRALHPPSASTAVATSVAAEAAGDATSDAVTALVLRVDGLDADVLRAALARRRPDLQILGAGQSPVDVGRTAYVEVVADLPHLTLDVVHADGRAWRRTLDTGSAPGERAAARLLVQLLAAIAERRAEPERRDVPVPAWTRDPRVADAPTEVPAPEATLPEPIAAPTPPTTTIAPPVDLSPETAGVEPPPAARTPPRPPATLELGLAADFTALVGLTPPRDVSALRGLGGAVHIDLKWPRAVVLGLGLRGLARAHDDLHLARLRGAVTVGWLARRGRFEALLAAGLSLETWRVRQQGDPVYYAEPGADIRPLLLGGLVRAAPGVRLVAGPRLALRLGAWLELAASVLPTGAAARLSRTRHDGAATTPLFALGGIELAMGLELAAWFTLRRRP